MDNIQFVALGCVSREKYDGLVVKKNEPKTLKEKLVKWYLSSQEYIHCELAFMDTKDSETNTVMACGVFREDGVFWKPRTFSNIAYDWIYIQMSNQEYIKVKDWCIKQIGKKFDEKNVYSSSIWPRKRTKNTFWCVPFVVEALQLIGMFQFVTPESLDPEDVVYMVKKSSRQVFGLSPTSIEQDNTDITKMFR